MSGNEKENRFGPRFEADGVRFQLWAPAAQRVAVVIGDQPAVDMGRDHEGYWQVVTRANVGSRYRFLVDGRLVPDPASRFQPDDVEGPSQLVGPSGYEWRCREWTGRPWEEIVIYEAHAGIFGGFRDLIRRLSDLADLGITALELMPIGDFAGPRNWGYDGVLPFAPDSAYGSPDDLRSLIDAAHGLGLCVYLDVVYNHFGPIGNWLPAYAPTFFDEARQTPWGAAIDFNKAPVRRFFIENAIYWLTEFRFDGLRLDAVHAISDRSWLLDLSEEIRRTIPGRHIHLMLENENNDAGLLENSFDAQWNDDFHNTMHVLLTAERHAYYTDFASRPAEKLVRSLAEGFVYQGEPTPRHGTPRGQTSRHLSPTKFINFLQNHDQVGNRALGERLTSLADQRALRAAMTLLLMTPHIPMLFMGEEVGSSTPFLFFTSFTGTLADAVRDGRRKEFADSPSFTDGDLSKLIPDPNDTKTFERSRWHLHVADTGWFEFVKELLAIRREFISPFIVGSRVIEAGVLAERAVRASWRLANGRTLTVAMNLENRVVQASLPHTKPIVGQGVPCGEVPPATTCVWLE